MILLGVIYHTILTHIFYSQAFDRVRSAWRHQLHVFKALVAVELQALSGQLLYTAARAMSWDGQMPDEAHCT